MAAERLPTSVLLRVLARSFFLQASWNFERLQNLGFFYVMAPALRYFYRGDELTEACRRHLDYFNTHPYLASPVLGVSLHLEGSRASGEEAGMKAGEFKKMVMAPYAAMGDAFFWGGLRPLAACIAIFFAAKGSLWAPVLFLLFFNLPHLGFRILGLWKGYGLGLGVIQLIQGHRLPDLAIRAKEATVVMLGGVCALLVVFSLRQEGVPLGWGLAVLPLVAGLRWLTRRGISVLLLVLTTCAVMVFLGQL